MPTATEPRLADIATFLKVHRTGSITGAARELGVTPSQVSKAIMRLEAAFQGRLVTRGARGIGLSAMGRQVLPRLQQVVALMASVPRAGDPPDGDLTLAAPSSLLSPILPRIMNALPRMRVRGLELPPELLRGYSADELFDVALVPGGTSGLSTRWARVRVPGWETSEELFLVGDVERVLARVQTLIVGAVRSALFDVPETPETRETPEAGGLLDTRDTRDALGAAQPEARAS